MATNQVFVLDKRKRPLMPCHPRRARELLDAGKAVVHRMVPFTIRLKRRIGGVVQPVRVCIDPGSKTTGFAVAAEPKDGERHALFMAELQHRGAAIHKVMMQRAAYRRGRRSRNLRYREPRFSNRVGRSKLRPSLQHRVDTVTSWVARFRRWAPVSAISMELVRFDTQRMVDPEIRGVEYQYGELAGYEVREYLLEKWGRHCAYCGKEGCPLNIDHIVARACGGSDRVSNLTVACVPCNLDKGKKPLAVWLASKPAVVKRIMAQAKASMRDAAAVNCTKNTLRAALEATGLPVECASGGRTKYNRNRLGVPKTHAGDALCVGDVTSVTAWDAKALTIKATGRGRYKRTRTDAFGYPVGYFMRCRSIFGFRTGDLVRAIVTNGLHRGTHVGRVAVRKAGRFTVGTARSVHHTKFTLLQRGDGYGYSN